MGRARMRSAYPGYKRRLAGCNRDHRTAAGAQITRSVIAFNTARVRSRVPSFSRITDT